jgi:hypothetical protein
MWQRLFSRAVRQTNWLGTPFRGRGCPSASCFPLCFTRPPALRVGLVYAQLFGYHNSRCLPLINPCVLKSSRLKNLPCPLGGFSILGCDLRCICRYFGGFCCLNGRRCCIRVRYDSAFPQRHSCRHIAILCLPHIFRVHEAVVLPEAASTARRKPGRRLVPIHPAAEGGVQQLSNP